MKRLIILSVIIGTVAILASCGGHDRPGRAYTPDMTYSRAYETYAPTEERLRNSGAESEPYFDGKPVPNTMARGDMAQYPYRNDSLGYAASANVVNPLNKAAINMANAERLYLINCAICHGPKLDGNGPLYKGGDGPYGAKPATLVGDAKYEAMPEGTMFHSVTYGKNAMGSYASQLTTEQRWEVIAYIKSKQKGGGAPAASDSTAAKSDSTGKMTADSASAK